MRNGGPIRIDQYSRVSSGSGGLVGTKTNPVNLYDNYGNVARGQIQTQTAMPGPSKLAQGFGALYVLQVADQHLSRLKAQGVSEMYSRGFEEGDWNKVASATAKLFDWTGFGGNVADSLWGNSDVQQMNQQMYQQALAQAQQQFNTYQPQNLPNRVNPADYKDYAMVTIREQNDDTKQRIDWKIPVSKADYSQYKYWREGILMQRKNNDNVSWPFRLGSVEISPRLQAGSWITITAEKATEQDLKNWNLSHAPQLAEIMPKEADMVRLMEQLLNDNNRNHTELINALWGAGVIGPGNTQSMVMGSPADNTFLTQPYTPEGANQAQQTQFIINNNGSITQNTIQRPDLVANSSQAPTRAEVASQHQQGQQDTRPQKEGSTAEKPDICAQNPNSMMCAPIGSTDYQDVVLPQQNINIALSPVNIFNTDAACPAPTSFSIAGTQQRISYEPMCDTARKARP
ncbi:IgG-binding virulence factor TspB family protein, partial [Eikenella longinqua]|uniref:IgG-binding virulence factor TspB family protein n=1 Tax=Eikenella longinqua TaxID=1795827 RepID=UPI000AE042EE